MLRENARMAAGFLMMGLASVGFPMTLGFIAEDLVVQGAVEHFPVLSFVLIVATALNGMTVMRAFFHLFSGRRVHTGESDLTNRESWALSAVLLILLAGGLAPSVITSREFRSFGNEVALPRALIGRSKDSNSQEGLRALLPLETLEHPHGSSILIRAGLGGATGE